MRFYGSQKVMRTLGLAAVMGVGVITVAALAHTETKDPVDLPAFQRSCERLARANHQRDFRDAGCDWTIWRAAH